MEIVITNFKRVLSLIDMGSDNSKPSPTLAEKRYKVERPPAKKKVRSASTVTSVAKRNSVESDTNTSLAVSREAFSETDFQGGVVREKVNESVLARPLQFENQKHFLTKRERILLEHSWKKSKKSGTEHVGSKIFLMVLTAQPDIKGIFGLEKIPQGRLKYDPRFRQHAQVFTKTFDYVIKNLEYPDKIEQHFEALGRRHVVMQGRGFDPLYWETFAECMTQTAVEWEAHKQRLTMSAWRNLVSTIISFMRRGFDEENAKRKFHQYPQRAYRASLPSSSGNTSSTGSTGSYNLGSHSSGSYNIGYQTPIRGMSPCPSNDLRCPTFTQNDEPQVLSYGTPNGVATLQCLAPQHVPNGSLQFARTASFCGVPGAPPQYHGMHQHVQQISNYSTNSAFSTPRNSWSGIYTDDSPMDYSSAVNDRDICSSRNMHTHRV